MASPIARQSIEGSSSEGSGSEVNTLGHYHSTVFAAVRNYSDGDDTVEVVLEGSPNKEYWDEITRIEDSLITDDPSSDAHTGTSFATGEYYHYLRARVATLEDSSDGDIEIDGWVMSGGNAGQGRRATSRNGPVSDL